MAKQVLIGASSGPGLAGLQVVRELKLGNCVLADLPFDRDEAVAMLRFCREHEITIFLSELVYRGTKQLYRPEKTKLPREAFWSKDELDAILSEAGDFYGGRMTIGEAGGVLYWPKDYLIGEGVGAFAGLPQSDTMLEPRDAYVEYLRDLISYERGLSDGPLMNVDSSLVFKYHAEAGIDVLCHEALPGDPHRMQAALRGAARAYGKPYGTHIAMGWYGGVVVDNLWIKRWKTSVWHCYLTGSEFIYPETGHLGLKEHQTGHVYEPQSPAMRAARRVLREVYQFALVHQRPEGGPKVKLGLVYGCGDGAPGLWNPWAWGQYHDDKWLAGPAEWGWELVDDLHRRADWPTYTVAGEHDWSGNPPYGQYDIVPIESDLDNLQRYSCLVFPGWNTMTEEIYEKLKAYVAGGGHLLMYLPQLRSDSVRGGEPQLFHGGDFSDLFGVKITGKQPTSVRGVKFLEQSSIADYALPVGDIICDPRFLGNFTPSDVELTTGRVLIGHDLMFMAEMEQVQQQPVLVENKLGDGVAMLCTLWEYPADTALLALTKELLRVVSAGEQGEVRVLGSDRVRYAVYDLENGEGQVIYLLNTDPDCSAPVRLWVEGQLSAEQVIPANEFVIAYRFGTVVVWFEDRLVNLERAEDSGEGLRLSCNAVNSQTVTLENLGAEGCAANVNEIAGFVEAGQGVEVPLERREVPGAAGYEPDFAEEPPYDREIDFQTAY